MDNFRGAFVKVLIATDISARGIDIPSVDYVVNYDVPEVAENYIHRVGRTGRGTNKGQAVTFCSTEEKDLLKIIENKLASPIHVLDISRDEYEFTVDMSEDKSHDWKALYREDEERELEFKKKKKRKKLK